MRRIAGTCRSPMAATVISCSSSRRSGWRFHPTFPWRRWFDSAGSHRFSAWRSRPDSSNPGRTSRRFRAVAPCTQTTDGPITHGFSAAISLPRGDDDSDDWYQHPLDSENTITEEIRGHAIEAGPGHAEPELVHHPRVDGRQVMPWIDYFAYWQSYELAETLRAVRLFAPVLNNPAAESALENALSSFDQLKEWSDRRIARVHHRYQERRRVFDWISRFRTLVGRASEKHTFGDLRLAAQNLSSQLDLTPAQVREDIRGVLLEMWREWVFPSSTIPREMRRCFQKDIDRAVRFHDFISEDRIDPFDTWWDPPDPNPRSWERLKEVLPLEWNKARLSLARFLPLLPETFCRDLGRRDDIGHGQGQEAHQ